ncbi:MAG: YheC/YheD family protein [Thermoflavifilum sp.]|nr:YheC/YheD family protein [Thermoflavifilum sp.]MCL6514707.1 YheC/YheD family protein [Alicyclobacillus sp.]
MARKPELGKYLLWRLFRRHPRLRPHLPDTARYAPDRLRRFLDRYGMVYVKPSGGSQGKGIMKVWREGDAVLVKKTVQKARRFDSVEAAIRHIDQQRAGKPYIVQQGLNLIRIDGRPVDIRVMAQRTRPGGPWLYSGMVAKIAGPGSVVTNVALSGGRVIRVEEALRRGLGWSDGRIRQCIKTLRELSLIAANHFDTYQPYREIGFDIGIDQRGRIWLIEENTAPSHPLMKKLGDPTLSRLIEARWSMYQRALQRTFGSANMKGRQHRSRRRAG